MLPIGAGAPGDLGCEAAGSAGWEAVGGLEAHVNSLKEMVLLPLLYPALFQVRFARLRFDAIDSR